MKAKKGYRKNKNITSFNNWFKRYFKKRTCKGRGAKNLINNNLNNRNDTLNQGIKPAQKSIKTEGRE